MLSRKALAAIRTLSVTDVFRNMILLAILLLPGLCAAQSPVGQVPAGITATLESDGVWRFDRQVKTPVPAFWQELLELFKLKPVAKPAFGRSVAFLTGVAHYEHQTTQLPFVDSDLTELRNFLLTQGGFDTVYEARGRVVSRSLIEDYLVNKFSGETTLLTKNDRLLFYYSGHGADKNGRIGFLEFSRSTPGNFAGDDVLEVDQFARWSRVIVAKHLLIILDSCASGLATASKASESSEDRRQMELNSLSGEGSGFLITAGTEAQKAYQLSLGNQKGYSVLTHSLLGALRDGQNDDAFMTINEVFGKAQKSVASFNSDEGKEMDPRIWSIGREDGEAKGTFVFVNINAKNPKPPPISSGITAAKGDDSYRVNPNDGQRYVWIPSGTFTMGCSPGDRCNNDETPHQVTISNGFWLGQTEVTQAAYERVTRTNPSHFRGENLPVEDVGWYAADSFCRSIGGRLPTEAEWEWAARAGVSTPRYGSADRIAWSGNNSDNQTHPVAMKMPNAWNLYDMLGNVWEWVADFRSPYDSASVIDPKGPSTGETHVKRGGGWHSTTDIPNGGSYIRLSSRSDPGPGDGPPGNVGFRCVADF